MPPVRRDNTTAKAAWMIYFWAVVSCFLWLLPLLSTTSVLFPGGPNFEDILVYKGRFTLFHTAKFFKSKAYSAFAYPAGCAPVYEALYKTHEPLWAYLLLAAIALAIAIAVLLWMLRRAGISFLFLWLLPFCFPFVFLIQRANIELVLWSLVALGLLAYARGWRYAAAVLIGIPAAMKLYPVFLLGLFLRKKDDLPPFLVGAATMIATMCGAIYWAGPDFMTAARGFSSGVSQFQGHYAQTVRSAEINFDHCLFSPVKYLSQQKHFSLHEWMLIYYLAAGTLAVLLFLRVRTFPFLNRVVFLTAAMVSLPPVSYTYTLVHLYLPAAFLLCALIPMKRPPASAVLALGCLLALFVPLVGASAVYPIAAGPMQSFVLLALLLLCTVSRWEPQTTRK